MRQAGRARLRPLYNACWFLSGAALVALWVIAPDCEGTFCMGAETASVAGAEAGGGEVPLAARQVFGVVSRDPSANAAAVGATETGDAAPSWPPIDFEPLPTNSGHMAPGPEHRRTGQTQARPATLSAGLFDFGLDGAGALVDPQAQQRQRDAWEEKAANAAEHWAAVDATALSEPDDELRGAAIRAITGQRDDRAVAVLLEVAGFDPAPENRLAALRTLWYSAADGLDADGAIRETLEQAAADPDERTAALARQALIDLESLEQARQAQ